MASRPSTWAVTGNSCRRRLPILEILTLSAYAVLAEGKTTYLTLINKEHGANPRDATVNIQSDGGQTSGEVIYLSAPGNDIAATNGITLGGAEIQNDASWNGKRQLLDAPTGTAPVTFAVKVPAATAAVENFHQVIGSCEPPYYFASVALCCYSFPSRMSIYEELEWRGLIADCTDTEGLAKDWRRAD